MKFNPFKINLVMKLLLCSFVLLTGCAKQHKNKLSTSIDPDLEPYVSAFFSEASARGITRFPLQLGSVSLVENVKTSESKGTNAFNVATERYVAFCNYAHNDITIERKFFVTATVEKREQIIFHELAHCVLGLQHISGKSWALIPASEKSVFVHSADSSIMVPFMHGDAFKVYRKHYLDALFQNKMVDFTHAFEETFPLLAEKIQEQREALESSINFIAARIAPRPHIHVELHAEAPSSLDGNVFHINYSQLSNTAFLIGEFFSAFEHSLSHDEAEGLRRNMRHYCAQQDEDHDYCAYLLQRCL